MSPSSGGYDLWLYNNTSVDTLCAVSHSEAKTGDRKWQFQRVEFSHLSLFHYNYNILGVRQTMSPHLWEQSQFFTLFMFLMDGRLIHNE